jgi:predicted dehydrogenase
MSDKVRVGLIGCGGIAGRHVQWFLAEENCEIAGLCDLSDEAIEKRKGEIQELRPGSDPYVVKDHRDLLADPDIDAVAVLLPHHLHYPIARDALFADKHVLVEKPMVTNTEQARDLVAEAEARGRYIVIGYQRSYLSEYQYVQQMVASGELGEIKFVSAHLEQTWGAGFRKPGGELTWRQMPDEVGGGQLVDTGSHTVAALLDVTGLVPKEAFAYVETCDLPVDLNTAAVVRFTNDAVASISIGGFGHSVTEVLRVVGDKKSARIFFRTVREQTLEVDGQVVDAKAAIPGSTPNANFIDAILNGAETRANGTLGLRVAQLTEALYTSAKEHRPVAIS